MHKTIAILGSTGSIGTQALDVVRALGYSVRALAAHSNVAALEAQIREFKPRVAALTDAASAADLRLRVADTGVKVLSGMDGLCAAAIQPEADMVLNAVVGMVGLRPTLAAIAAGKDIALSNKETLVAGGKLVMAAAWRQGVHILPVDSEHSAIFQCLQGGDKDVNRIILTASGGPFFGRTRDELQKITPAQALRHPNWSMGAKITIDCATMMNKGLEMLEASWLFNRPPEKIDIVVHRESIIHSMVEFVDYSVLAQMGLPDMRIPIQLALTYPDRFPSPAQRLSLPQIGTLSFFEPDFDNFPALALSYRAARQGGLYPAAMNGANEQAVALFLQEKIGFLEIPELIKGAMQAQGAVEDFTTEDVYAADQAAREYVLAHIPTRS